MALIPDIHSGSFFAIINICQAEWLGKKKKMLTVLGLEHAMNCICNLKMAYFLADE